MSLSRRRFCFEAASAVLASSGFQDRLQHGTETAAATTSTARPNVAVIDGERILAAAHRALHGTPRSITSFPAAGSPGEATDFYSLTSAPTISRSGPPIASAMHAEAGGGTAENGKENVPGPQAFTAHREALLQMTLAVPALAAAYVLLRGTDAQTAGQFAKGAMDHLRVWFVNPATRMNPSLEYGAMLAGSSRQQFEGVLETAALAEVAIAVTAVSTCQAISEADLSSVRGWFAEYLEWLMTSRLAGLARDQKDRHGSSWLLQSSAYALLTINQATVAELRHRYKTVTIRAQLIADGVFPHELTTPDPYRNSLFNLDMLAAATDLLSTRFETLWDFQLQDGPGMRVAMARFFPFIEHRSAWPYKADASHFAELPCRRPSLLFAARAYTRPEYADVWRSLPAEPTSPTILAAFPIRQPLLWTSRQRS